MGSQPDLAAFSKRPASPMPISGRTFSTEPHVDARRSRRPGALTPPSPLAAVFRHGSHGLRPRSAPASPWDDEGAGRRQNPHSVAAARRHLSPTLWGRGREPGGGAAFSPCGVSGRFARGEFVVPAARRKASERRDAAKQRGPGKWIGRRPGRMRGVARSAACSITC